MSDNGARFLQYPMAKGIANLKLPVEKFDEEGKEIFIHCAPLGVVIRIVP